MENGQVDINTILGIAIAYLVHEFVRWLAKRRFWKKVTERAKRYLEDPNVPITDPKQAAERALADQQEPSVLKVADSIKKGE